ncbi:MAG: ABC transporter ATP-binding protein [Pseudomonadota bacterium]|nr:ABC transporter ATP-binding protein [Pseudomonadota bacterium]
MTPLLDARAIALPYRLARLDVSSPGGELIALVGPNGGGKTSLLRALAQVEDASGVVLVDGEDLDRAGEARRRRLLSFLPASREIAWPIAVRDVIALGGANEAEVSRWLGRFELNGLAERTVANLSTGERARVFLARAMATGPRLLLLDEPLSNLDPYWVLRTLELLREETVRGATLLVALHDISLVERFDRLLLLEHGRIVGDGTASGLSNRLGALFGVEPAPKGGWQINPLVDRRSSP